MIASPGIIFMPPISVSLTTKREIEATLHFWRYVGHLLGVQPERAARCDSQRDEVECIIALEPSLNIEVEAAEE